MNSKVLNFRSLFPVAVAALFVSFVLTLGIAGAPFHGHRGCHARRWEGPHRGSRGRYTASARKFHAQERDRHHALPFAERGGRR